MNAKASDMVATSGGMARNMLHLGIGQVATTTLTIVLTAVIARTLGAAEFGLLYLLMSAATFAYVFVDWGHGPYIVREAARDSGRSGELLGSALVVRALSALMASVVVVVLMWLLGYELRTRLLTGALILAWMPQYLGLSFGWIFRARDRMDLDALLQFALKSSTLIVSLACLWLGGRAAALVFTWTIAGLSVSTLAVFLYRRIGLPHIRVAMSTARELLHQGAPMLALYLAIAVEPYLITNILYKFASAHVVGFYGAAMNIAGTLIAPANILVTASFPRLSRSANDTSEYKSVLRMTFRPLLLVAVLCAVGTYLFADVAVGVIYSQQAYGPAADLLRAFALVALMTYIDLFLVNAVLAAGSAGQLAWAKGAVVALTAGLALYLVPYCELHFSNGALGAMYALIAGEFVMMSASLFFTRRYIDGRMGADCLRALIAGGVTIVLVHLVPALSPFLAIPMCVCVFLLASAAVGLIDRSDARVLIELVRSRARPTFDRATE